MCFGDWCRYDIVDDAELLAVAQTNTAAPRHAAVDREDDGLVDDDIYL